MLDPKLEIFRLRSILQSRGHDEGYINDVCDQAIYEMEQSILDIVKYAYQEAVSAGVEIGAEEFVAELKPVYTGNTFHILTDSGRMDFSEPPYPMLSRLLSNGKVSKEGNIYKVIPIAKKASGQQSKKVQFSVLDVMEKINTERSNLKEKRKARGNKGERYKMPDPWEGANTFTEIVKSARTISKDTVRVNDTKNARTTSSDVEFRTASSKQDATTQWVKPARELDMSGALMEINNRLENNIDSAINDTINRYEGAY